MKKIWISIFILSLTANAYANGTITGTVKYNGPMPFPKIIHMDADPICYAVNKGNTQSLAIIVGDNDTLADAFVYIKSGLRPTNYPLPAEDAVVNQAGCNYSPRVLGVMAGQKIKFLNPDGTLHNVHAMCQINPEFNGSMPDFRKEMEISFNKPEFMFPVRCDVHPWMKMWVSVMAHPFFAVTDKNGEFEIKNVPPGTYTLEAWHDKLETQIATITVTDNTTQKINFTFSTPK